MNNHQEEFFNQKERILKMRERILRAEQERISGCPTIDIYEAHEKLRGRVSEKQTGSRIMGD